MEWVSLKPSYQDGQTNLSFTQHIFSLLTKAGFQLEQCGRGISPATEEYFYFHPGLRIQVHAVKWPEQLVTRFFVFYPDGSTAYAESPEQLQALL